MSTGTACVLLRARPLHYLPLPVSYTSAYVLFFNAFKTLHLFTYACNIVPFDSLAPWRLPRSASPTDASTRPFVWNPFSSCRGAGRSNCSRLYHAVSFPRKPKCYKADTDSARYLSGYLSIYRLPPPCVVYFSTAASLSIYLHLFVNLTSSSTSIKARLPFLFFLFPFSTNNNNNNKVSVIE